MQTIGVTELTVRVRQTRIDAGQTAMVHDGQKIVLTRSTPGTVSCPEAKTLIVGTDKEIEAEAAKLALTPIAVRPKPTPI